MTIATQTPAADEFDFAVEIEETSEVGPRQDVGH